MFSSPSVEGSKNNMQFGSPRYRQPYDMYQRPQQVEQNLIMPVQPKRRFNLIQNDNYNLTDATRDSMGFYKQSHTYRNPTS